MGAIPFMAFGGFKQIGNGLESGYQGIMEYLQVKTTSIAL
jgi:acyl-CoA reductase-like NAD-dependent aldehyde dehydrogenase